MLPVHITAGFVAIAAGAVALYALKGGRLHRKSGMVFVWAMWVMAALGGGLAARLHERLNVAMAVLTFYFVTTALLTVRRRAGRFHWTDAAAMLVALLVGVYQINLGLTALHSPTGKVDGIPAAPMFIFGGLALLAALGDIRLMLLGGLRGAQRIARHLWRMCFALFVATGSFFLGQADVFPRSMRIIPLLAIPALLPLLLMVYWLARVSIRRSIGAGSVR